MQNTEHCLHAACSMQDSANHGSSADSVSPGGGGGVETVGLGIHESVAQRKELNEIKANIYIYILPTF